jgi:hypothetical protein
MSLGNIIVLVVFVPMTPMDVQLILAIQTPQKLISRNPFN